MFEDVRMFAKMMQYLWISMHVSKHSLMFVETFEFDQLGYMFVNMLLRPTNNDVCILN